MPPLLPLDRLSGKPLFEKDILGNSLLVFPFALLREFFLFCTILRRQVEALDGQEAFELDLGLQVSNPFALLQTLGKHEVANWNRPAIACGRVPEELLAVLGPE